MNSPLINHRLGQVLIKQTVIDTCTSTLVAPHNLTLCYRNSVLDYWCRISLLVAQQVSHEVVKQPSEACLKYATYFSMLVLPTKSGLPRRIIVTTSFAWTVPMFILLILEVFYLFYQSNFLQVPAFSAHGHGDCPTSNQCLCYCCKSIGLFALNNPDILLWLLNTRYQQEKFRACNPSFWLPAPIGKIIMMIVTRLCQTDVT